MDEAWLAAAVAEALSPGSIAVPDAVERMDALLGAWAVGFRSRRADVTTASLRHGSRGLHPDECGAFLRALDARQLHVDSAGYVTPLCATPKRGQQPYALCCRAGDGVTVNLEYVIQLGAVAELASLGWPGERLRVELGEFDAAGLDSDGSPAVLMEARHVWMARTGWRRCCGSGSFSATQDRSSAGRTPRTSTWSCSGSPKSSRTSTCCWSPPVPAGGSRSAERARTG